MRAVKLQTVKSAQFCLVFVSSLNPLSVRKCHLLFLISVLTLAVMRGVSGQLTSTNWAGYLIQATGVTGISASWTVPEVQCSNTAGTSTVAKGESIWIGIDGTGKANPEQVGTDSVCYNGSPSYAAWIEDPTLSHAMVSFPDTSYDDHITASIAYLGNNQFRFNIADAQTGNSRTYTVIVPNAARASAEWIVELPYNTNTGKQLTLADFQSVTFTDCTAAVNNVPGSILQNNAQPLNLIDNKGNIVITTQNLNSAGTSFQVVLPASPTPESPSVLPLLVPAFAVALLLLRSKRV